MLTYVKLIHSANDYEYACCNFAHGEHVLDFDETFYAGIVDECNDSLNKTRLIR